MNWNLKTTCIFEVNTYDIDVAGHVNNIVYIRWLEDLRTKLLNENFDFDKLIADNYYPFVVSTNITYKKQIKLFDNPTGTMKVCSHNHGVITLEAVFKIENVVAAKAEQKCVIVDLETSKMINLNSISYLSKDEFSIQ